MRVVSQVTERALISLPTVCRKLGRSYSAVYNLILSGRLPAERIDGRWLVDVHAVENFADTKTASVVTAREAGAGDR
jgi:hypothetical protein